MYMHIYIFLLNECMNWDLNRRLIGRNCVCSLVKSKW